MCHKVRAGQVDAIIVSVTQNGAAVTGTKVRISLPGGKTVTERTGKNGKAKFTVEPTQRGTITCAQPELQSDDQGEGVRRQGGDGGSRSVLYRLT